MTDVLNFEIPLHRSLTSRIMMAGVPKHLCLMNMAIGASCLLVAHSIIGSVLSLVAHIALVYCHRKDEYFYEVLLRSFSFKTFYKA